MQIQVAGMSLKEYLEPSGQLCWTCKKACGLCPWTEYDPVKKKVRFEPIPGWEATAIHRPSGHGTHGTEYMDTYSIKKCPLYEKENPRDSADDFDFLGG